MSVGVPGFMLTKVLAPAFFARQDARTPMRAALKTVMFNLVLTIALVAAAITFLLARALFAWRPLLLAMTPGAIKTRRAHARALSLFRAGAEKRTTGATGVLLYLSLDEHRAEIIADAAIHGKVTPETWGEAMAALLEAVKDGRPGDGMAAAVGRIGAILAEHFPRNAADMNELPDRLIEL